MVMRALIVLLLLVSNAHAESYWLWAIAGKFEQSKSPCADDNAKRTNPAKQALYTFIGAETFIERDENGISLRRGKILDEPRKQLVGPNGEQIAIWYHGARTWIVTLQPNDSPARASVTLVIEKDAKRSGKPVCHERWIAPVSP